MLLFLCRQPDFSAQVDRLVRAPVDTNAVAYVSGRADLLAFCRYVGIARTACCLSPAA